MKIHGTAKGGAISKKDFGVAFGGNGRTFTLVWENTATGTNFYVAASPNLPAAGQAFYTGHVAIGEIPTKITFNLKKTDTPFEDAELKLIASDNTVKASFGTIDASTLTTSYVTHEFTNTDNVAAIANGDRLAWFYNFDNADGTFDFQGSTVGIANTAATYSVNLTTWVDRSTEESTMAIYSG